MEQWDNFLQEQEKNLGKEVVTKWLRSLKIIHFDACNLYLEAENSFQISWFEEHFRPLVKARLFNNNHHPIKVHLANAAEKKTTKSKKKPQQPSTLPIFKIDSDPLLENASFQNYIPGEKNRLAFQFLLDLASRSLNKSALPEKLKHFDEISHSSESAYAGRPIGGERESKDRKMDHFNGCDHLFNDLKLGSFNPIYLYGQEGVGKTHLLMACAKELIRNGTSAFYVHAETFTEHVVKAIRNSQMQEFRKIYRNQQVLIIDDIEILSRKAATQEELFHTFNTFHTQGRQIILSSNAPPSRLIEIEPRLISRFEWGILFHLEKLTPLEMKQAAQAQFEKWDISIQNECMEYLITLFPRGMKSLLPAMEILVQDYNKHALPFSKERINMLLVDLIDKELEVKLTPQKIVGKVAEYFGITSTDILGKSQAHEYTLPRQIAMELCRSKLGLPYLRIGHFFSRDHSTVMFSIKQIEKKKLDPEVQLDRIFYELERLLML